MPKKDRSSSRSDSALREDAEKRLSERPGKKWPHDDPLSLIHKLQVHQIELEMQNEEVRRAQLEIEKSKEKYLKTLKRQAFGFRDMSMNTSNSGSITYIHRGTHYPNEKYNFQSTGGEGENGHYKPGRYKIRRQFQK